jgi:predicted dehydrogenase
MQQTVKPVVIGTVGAGYAACLHGNGYEKVSGVPVHLKTVCDLKLELAQKVKERYGYEQAISDYKAMLADPEIDIIDIVTPPFLHCSMAIQAMRAGKHVICEKPLTGYFGAPGEENVGTTPKARMYQEIIRTMDELKAVIDETGKKFMYAENFVYATPIRKAAELVQAKKSKILFLQGFVGLKGSSSPSAGQWNKTGGGQLMRNGTHPLSGMLWLKQQEAQARGESITVQSVTADVGVTTACLSEYEHRHISARPEDVEDYAAVSVTFSDGTKCLTIASDAVLGGTHNTVDVFCNDGALRCNITPPKLLDTYFLDEEGLEQEPLGEMLPSKLGWNTAFVSDEVIRGYLGELQDFMEAVAFDREPAAGFPLAYETAKIMYAAYQSAEEGRRIDF